MSNSCIECGTALQDAFVLVDSDSEEDESKQGKTAKNVEVIADAHVQLLIRERISELVDETYGYNLELSEDDNIEEKKELCFSCSKLAFEELETQIREADLERRTYISYLEALKNTNNTNSDEDIKKLADEELRWTSAIEEMNASLLSIREQKKQLSLEKERVAAEDERFWKNHMEYQWNALLSEEERVILQSRQKYGSEELRRLESINVHQDTFYIVTTEKIGTINGFRLGRLPDIEVEWEEINAALGQTALLTYTLAKKIGYDFPKFRLRLMGNRTTIQSAKDLSVVYPLYGSSDLGFGSWFWGLSALTSSFTSTPSSSNTLDDGMVAFLQCFADLCAKAKSLSPSLDFPYKIEKDKIGGYLVRMQSNNEKVWTKALKYVLIILNYLLAWVSSRKT